jgi:hypothetical protein
MTQILLNFKQKRESFFSYKNSLIQLNFFVYKIRRKILETFLKDLNAIKFVKVFFARPLMILSGEVREVDIDFNYNLIIIG